MVREDGKRYVDPETVSTVVGAVSEYTAAAQTIVPGAKTNTPMQDLLRPGKAEDLRFEASKLKPGASARGTRASG